MSIEVLLIGIALGLVIGIPLRYLLYRKTFQSAKRNQKIIALIKEKKYKEAIQLGKSIPVTEISWIEKINLIAAYYHSGQINEAKKLLSTITKPSPLFGLQMPPEGEKLVEDWQIKLSKY